MRNRNEFALLGHLQIVIALCLAFGFIFGYALGGIDAREDCAARVSAFVQAMADADEPACADDTSCSILCVAEGLQPDCWAELDPTGESGR